MTIVILTNKLGERSVEIGKIVDTINNISDETKNN